MHADADGCGTGVDDRSDLVEREPGAIAQGEQMLVLGPEVLNQGAKLSEVPGEVSAVSRDSVSKSSAGSCAGACSGFSHPGHLPRLPAWPSATLTALPQWGQRKWISPLDWTVPRRYP